MSQLPFLFSGGAHFQPTHHQTVYNNTPPSNPAAPSSIPQTQQAFMQNSQLPGIDMATVLQGITPEQLAYIGRLYQSGQIPLPPAQNLPATQPAANTQDARSENVETHSIGRQEAYPTTIGQSNANGEHTKQEHRGFLHPPPTAPRKRSGSVQMRPDNNGVDKRTKRQQSPPRQPHGYDRRRPEPRADDQTSSPARSTFRHRKAKQDAAKEFILSLYRAGFVFDDIARELSDARMLRVIFEELRLDAPTEKLQSMQGQVAPVSAHARGQKAPFSAAATPTQGSPVSVAASKPAPKAASKPLATTPAPVSADRSAYLAKLQAAKNKKNESPVAASKSPAPATSQKLEAQQPAVPNAVPVSSQSLVQQQTPQQPKKVTVQTELIRKRLEALKAEQARRQEAERLANAAATSAPVTAPVMPSVIQSATETPVRSTNATPQVASPAPAQQSNTAVPTQSVASPAPAFDFTSQFPGLPGLFMTGTPTQVSAPASRPATLATPMDVSQPASSPESGLVTSGEPSPSDEADFPMYEASLPTKVSAASSGQITPKHPFNQNRYDSNDDSVIIQVTDDEESELDDMEEDDDDIDDEVAPSPAAKAAAPLAKPGPIRNFPAPTVSSSTPATPGATTPGGTLYERKMQEINEMNRRIAEMQKAKAKLNSPAVPQTQASSALPGLGNSLGNVPAPLAVPPGPVEQQFAESSQRMEAKLAQLEEEAEIISEQTHSPPQATHVASEQPHKDANADSTTSSDDDDAMDLSSGDDLDSDDQDNGIENTALSAGEDSHEEAIPEGICANELAMMSESSSDSEDSSTDSEEESEEEYEPAPAALAPETVSSTSTSQASPHDIDLAPELQPAASEQGSSNATPEATTKPFYKPYESPLRMFKDYRFHPKYNSDVQGGFKSLTYSNKLDPTEPMCPNELSSGTCQDPACLHQHFSNTAINDGELLKDLGTRNAPWKTEEEKLRWNNGLSEVVKQLRNSNQGTDVNAIAARIAQYRREFIGIPDQVLNLHSA